MRPNQRLVTLLSVCLVLLQGMDFFLTWGLLNRSPEVREANPLARAVLEQHGWGGLGLMKVVCTAIILAASLLVHRRRARLGAGLLGGVCLLMAGVDGYSLTLFRDDHQAVLEEQYAVLDTQTEGLLRFNAHRVGICRGLLDGRLTLPAAVQELADCIRRERFCLPIPFRRTLPDAHRLERVAVYLAFQSHFLAAREPRFGARAAALREEVARLYPRAPKINYTDCPLAHPLLAPWIDPDSLDDEQARLRALLLKRYLPNRRVPRSRLEG
jgi:hypothetical protein